MKNILVVVGTRPNFIKVTRFREVASRYPDINLRIVHTGQHYDHAMAEVFFQQFGLQPDFFLDIPATSPNSQMANIMLRLEELFATFRPHLLLVVGDVNSTAAAALTGNKCGIPIGHIESGLRSFDRTMPEEFNRLITDELCDYLFVTEQSGTDHLKSEGKKGQVFFVGNTMIDTLVAFSKQIDASDVLEKLGVQQNNYLLMTMHRPATVDTPEGLEKLLDLIAALTKRLPLVFPVHPRTLSKMRSLGLEEKLKAIPNVHLLEPLGYFDFQRLVKEARCVVTDSGGIQEESTFLGVPCFTLRPNTERPVTVTVGTNELMPFDIPRIEKRLDDVMNGTYKKGEIPRYWDGQSTERIFEQIREVLQS